MAEPWLWLRVGWAALTSRSDRAFYDRIAPIYDRLYVSHHVHAATIAELLSAHCGGREGETLVLDLGCGTGILGAMLAGRGFRVVGVDLSLESLRVQSARHPGAALVQADAARLPLASGCVQSVACLGAWRHFPDAGKVMDEIRRVLALDGELFISYFPPALGRLLTAIYARLIGIWGYADRADAGLEQETARAARERFREVETMPSGGRWRLIRARHPVGCPGKGQEDQAAAVPSCRPEACGPPGHGQ
jgi:SAM-dependent methyltransferase